MKNFVRLAIAAAVAVGASSGAFAQSLPNSGNADLWVFVTDPGASDTFAWDTGISLNSLTPSTLSTTAKATTTTDPVTINAQSSALASFIASSTDGSALQWAVEGVQYTGSSPAADKAPGSFVGVASQNVGAANISALKQGALGIWGQAFQGDVAYLSQTYTPGSGGSSYLFSAGSAGGNVWGAGGNNNSGGSTNLYGQGPTQAGTGIGTAESLYLLTGSNSTLTAVESYTLGADDLTLSANGTLATAGGTSPVPLPAAVWLFGSGLLGLMGVGRRRAA
jgi:hypothetical protein